MNYEPLNSLSLSSYFRLDNWNSHLVFITKSNKRCKSTLIQHVFLVQPADIWSLGVTLYAMLTGRVPWTASSPAELQRKVQNEPLVYPAKPQISRSLKHLLGRMLDKNPSTRATMQEIKVSFLFLGFPESR